MPEGAGVRKRLHHFTPTLYIACQNVATSHVPHKCIESIQKLIYIVTT